MLSNNYDENISSLNKLLEVDKSFDIIRKDMIIKGKKSAIYFIDGFVKDDILEKIMEFWLGGKFASDIEDISESDVKYFCNAAIPYVEVDIKTDLNDIALSVLSGSVLMLFDSFSSGIIIDARTYPTRSVEEPEKDKVLRGAHVGFVETIIFNTALLRRHIRDVNLRIEMANVGNATKTDVAIVYMENKVDKDYLKIIQKKLKKVNISALNMAQESLAEALIKNRWYNPFPKIRYTERPDVAAATVLEGSILVFCDNSSSVMILPCCFLDFFEEADDYYFPPIVGTYMRFIRIFIFFATLLLIPVWYLLVENPNYIPSFLKFIEINEPYFVPILFQILLIEVAIDGLKLASMNTPSVLSNSLGVIGGLILSEYAIQAEWFAAEVIFYMAFVAIANFTQSSFELGYAIKFLRVLMVVLTAIFNIYGFFAGLILTIVLLFTNKTINGKRHYMYPIYPFNGKLLLKKLFRKRL